MEPFRWSQLIRFSIALVAQILLCASWNWFDDWTIPEMPIKFVVAGMQCSLAYLIAIREFPVNASPRLQAGIFWGAVVALRLVALPRPRSLAGPTDGHQLTTEETPWH